MSILSDAELATSVDSLKTEHPDWQESQIRAVLQLVQRGHYVSLDGASQPSDSLIRRENRDLEQLHRTIGLSASLFSVQHNKYSMKEFSTLVLRDTLPTDEEMQKIEAAIQRRNDEREKKYAAMNPRNKLVLALNGLMQSQAISPEAMDGMPVIGGSSKLGSISFLSEPENVNNHVQWLQHTLQPFFRQPDVLYFAVNEDAKTGQCQIVLEVKDPDMDPQLSTHPVVTADLLDRLWDKHLNHKTVEHYAHQSGEHHSRWAEMMERHHERREIHNSRNLRPTR